MNKIVVVVGIFLFSLGYTFQNVKAQEQKNFYGIIKPFVDTNNFSGSVMIQQKGKTIFEDSFGRKSLEFDLKNAMDTKFYLASVSMIFTSAAIMKLVENGKINLEDKLDKFIPDYQKASKITIHQMLAQRSGIPAIGKFGNIDYTTITQFTQTPQSLYSLFKDYDLLFEPGSEYSHERSEYILLALIIEKTTGRPFGEYLKDEIFVPLGMKNTGHSSSEGQIIINLARGYATKDLFDLEVANQIDWSSKTGHASIYSTAQDLMLFIQASQSNQLLTEPSWEKIFTDYGGDSVGYGWFVRDNLGRKRVHMNGRSPGFSSFLCIYPEEELAVVVLSNIYTTVPTSLGNMLASKALDEPFEPLNLSNAPISEAYGQEVSGVYEFGENFYVPNFKLKVEMREGNLYTDWGGLLPVENKFKEIERFILRTYWSDVKFVKKKGETLGMKYDEFFGKKIR